MVPEIGGWRQLESGAPDIARLGMERLTATQIALLGTLRQGGAPRISPVEPYLVEGHLLVGAMSWSEKVNETEPLRPTEGSVRWRQYDRTPTRESRSDRG